MELRRLSLRDFRNFRAVDGEGGEPRPTVIEFGSRFTILWGHNGAGKTNVLEALYLVSTLRSFRSAKLEALLRRGQQQARVVLEAFDHELGLPTQLEVRIDRGARSTRRSARLNGKLVRSAADFYGEVQAVLFTPEDLGVLRGSPSARRQFLDRVVFARERRHIGDIQAYEKLLRSRNRVLKDEHIPRSERGRLLDSYDVGLAEVGARVWSRRVALVEALAEPFRAAFAHIHDRLGLDGAEGPEAGLHYRSRLVGEGTAPREHSRRQEALSAALKARRPRDEAAQRTTVGPQLDDLELTLDGSLAADFASQGQARALILSFKIAELRAAQARSARPPLLLLDDVSSELDPARSARLFEVLSQEVGQCVLTTTGAHHVKLAPQVERREIELRDGVPSLR